MVHREIENKFLTSDDFPVPDACGLGELSDPIVEHLAAVYYDTLDLSLTLQGIVVRRRRGGSDEGWHVKLPVAGARMEHHAPLAGHLLPAELRQLLTPLLKDQPLVPVAQLDSTRTSCFLTDQAGKTLLQICYDDVRIDDKPGWREVEVELVDGTESDLAQVSAQFTEAGLTPSVGVSKIQRALEKRKPVSSTGLRTYIARQVGVLQARDGDVRIDVYDTVHQARVATRRLRSVLKIFSAHFKSGKVSKLRRELGWFAEVLGRARDAEVLIARMTCLATECSLDDVSRERLLSRMRALHDQALQDLVAAMGLRRYDRLHVRMMKLLTTWPVSGPEEELDRMVDEAIATLVDDAAKAAEHPDVPELWHTTRKSAKVVRYCTEALSHREDDRVLAWEEVTENLGNWQDARISIELVTSTRDDAGNAGELTSGYDRILEHETQVRDESLAAGQQAVARAIRVSREYRKADHN